MPNVIVRDVATDDVAVLKRAAESSGVSLQKYLAQELHEEAARLRRQEAIAKLRARMKNRTTVNANDITKALATMRAQRDEHQAGVVT